MAKFEFKKFIKLNKENLKERMMKLPSITYEYGLQDNTLHDKFETLELDLKEEKSKMGAQTRAKYRRVKTVTETEIKDIVNSSESVLEIERGMLKIKKLIRLSKLRMKVLGSTGEMAVNVNHNVREELKRTHNRK